jgi:histidine triad (HIT) family protein
MISPECVFCALYDGTIEASTVFRNEHLMAAMTIRPTHVGHVLLFPRAHVEDFALLDQETLGYLFHVAARLKLAICEAIPCQGFQLLINQGEATNQKRNCRHLHVHLIPCSLGAPGDVEGQRAEAPRRELDAAASKIAQRLNLDASGSRGA